MALTPALSRTREREVFESGPVHEDGRVGRRRADAICPYIGSLNPQP
jgi:hypothetical protein